MLHINPINYRDNNYSIVRKKDKVERVSAVSSNRDKNGSMNKRNSNSSSFKEILEEEIQKKKQKTMKRED